MDPKKLELIQEILSHLSGAQSMGLKDLLDKSKMPKEMPGEMGKPKGLEVESIEIEPKEGKEGGSYDDKVDQAIKDGSKHGGEDDSKEIPMDGDKDELTDEELEMLLKNMKL